MPYETPSFDEKLWVTVKNCCESRHYLISNPHTFPGRMSVWCPVTRVAFRVSKSEITSASPESEYWIKGFLVGNEPHPPRSDEGDYLPDDHPEMLRWRAAIQQFPETGIWIYQEKYCEACGELLLPTQPGFKCGRCIQNSSDEGSL